MLYVLILPKLGELVFSSPSHPGAPHLKGKSKALELSGIPLTVESDYLAVFMVHLFTSAVFILSRFWAVSSIYRPVVNCSILLSRTGIR